MLRAGQERSGPPVILQLANDPAKSLCGRELPPTVAAPSVRAPGAARDQSGDFFEKSGPEGRWVVDKLADLCKIGGRGRHSGLGDASGWPLVEKEGRDPLKS